MSRRVTGTARAQRTATTGLLEKLMAAVRSEFRVDVYLPDPDDPVLGTKLCRVTYCDRPGPDNGLCSRHAHRWRQAGRPDLSKFADDAGPPLQGRSEPGSCAVAGCHYGVSSVGLCMRHRSNWTTAGQPDVKDWIAATPAVQPVDVSECRLPFCTLWTENDTHFLCKSHTTRWRQLGSPALDDFIDHCLLRGRIRIDFRALAGQLRLEFQYAVQCRRDDQTATTPPQVVRWAMRRAVEAGVRSLLDLSEHSGAYSRTVSRGGRAPGCSCSTPLTSSQPCTRAPDGRWSTPATCGAFTRWPG